MNGSTLVFYKHRQFATIKDAIDEAVRQGETSISMFIRNGTYDISDTLLISTSNIVIRGEDITQTVLKLKASINKAVIQIGDGTNAASNITIENLELDGNKANQSSSAGVGVINIKKSISNLTIRHCNIHDGEKCGIFAYQTTSATTTNMKIVSCLIHDNGKDAYTDGAGIEIWYAAGTVISDNYIYNNGDAPAVNAEDGSTTTYVYNNLIDSNGQRGVSIDTNALGGIIVGNIITNNDYEGMFGTGNCVIIGNFLSNNNVNSAATYKAEIFANGYSLISGNFIKVVNASRSDYGIYCGASCNYNVVNNNILIATVANCDYGIYINETSDYNTVVGNMIKSFTDDLYVDAGSTHDQVANNIEA